MESPGRRPLSASALALIAVNLVPLFGAIFAGWDVFAIVLLYWLETAVIGGINILRIVTAGGDIEGMVQRLLAKHGGRMGVEERADLKANLQAQVANVPPVFARGAKLFTAMFFCVHFGIFMLVHLMFIFGLLGGDGRRPGGSPFSALGRVGDLFTPLMWFTLLGLLASHLFSFFINYIGKGEYRETTPMEQMMRPYGRVVVMHLAILFGAFATMALRNNIAILILLIGGKVAIDLTLHLRDHRKMEEKVAARDRAAVDLEGEGV